MSREGEASPNTAQGKDENSESFHKADVFRVRKAKRLITIIAHFEHNFDCAIGLGNVGNHSLVHMRIEGVGAVFPRGGASIDAQLPTITGGRQRH